MDREIGSLITILGVVAGMLLHFHPSIGAAILALVLILTVLLKVSDML
jgi:uncharacterized membrane protein YgaE (UPF0421/DUF939 family)